MLTEQLEKLKNLLPESYKPFPLIDDRNFWNNVSSDTKNAYISQTESYMESDIPVMKASLFMEFHRNGNRSNYQKFYSARRKALNTAILSELMENKGRFIDFIIDISWMICEETTWIIPAHNNIGGYKHTRLPLPDLDRPIIDLMSADTGASMAAVLYFFRDKLDAVTPQISRRIKYELDRRIIREYQNHTDYWWMGFMGDRIEQLNNWNPWINSNILLTLLMTEQNPEDRFYILQKLTMSLDEYLAGYPEDGGCDEGPGYWGKAGASLFECIEILHEFTGGAIDIFTHPKIKNMCAFIHRAHIGGNLFVNFADASPTATINPSLIYRFGKSTNNPESMAFGVKQQSLQISDNSILGRFGLNGPIREFMVFDEMTGYKKEYIAEPSVFLEDIEVAYLRTSTNKGELFIAAKGGNNLENHNHNDVGNFIIYGDGKPFLIDVGNMVYTKKTFSPQRYEIWSNCALWHNTPDINGFKQICGRNHRANNVLFDDSPESSVMTMEIQEAYPKESGILNWTRTVTMDHDDSKVIIGDSYKLESSGDKVYLRMMTLPEPVINSGLVKLTSGDKTLEISYSDNLEPEYEKINLEDQFHKKNWGETIYRMSFRFKNAAKSDSSYLKFKLL